MNEYDSLLFGELLEALPLPDSLEKVQIAVDGKLAVGFWLYRVQL